MNTIAIRGLWLVATFTVISSCGIPTTQFLGAPLDISASPTPPTVTFPHNFTDNDTENFDGYEIYYKFYQWMPNPADGLFGADLSIITSAGSGTGTVIGQGFRRLWEADGTVANLPLITLDDRDPDTVDPDASDEFYVQILFPVRPSASSPDPTVARFVDKDGVRLFPDRSVQLVRDPQAATGPSGETFQSDDISTDPNDLDVPDGIPPTDDLIHMAIVVLAYGIDYTETFEPLYSEPLMVDRPLDIILQ